eukprot:s7434_g4.t1
MMTLHIFHVFLVGALAGCPGEAYPEGMLHDDFGDHRAREADRQPPGPSHVAFDYARAFDSAGVDNLQHQSFVSDGVCLACEFTWNLSEADLDFLLNPDVKMEDNHKYMCDSAQDRAARRVLYHRVLADYPIQNAIEYTIGQFVAPPGIKQA